MRGLSAWARNCVAPPNSRWQVPHSPAPTCGRSSGAALPIGTSTLPRARSQRRRAHYGEARSLRCGSEAIQLSFSHHGPLADYERAPESAGICRHALPARAAAEEVHPYPPTPPAFCRPSPASGAAAPLSGRPLCSSRELAKSAFLAVPVEEWDAIRLEVFAQVRRRRAWQADQVDHGRAQMELFAR